MRRWIIRHPLLSFCSVAVVWLSVLYSGVLNAPFVYDDLDQIANNPALQSWHAVYTRFVLAPVSLTSSFLSHGGTTYRPLFWGSLALDQHLWGTSAAGFHFTNLLLHGLNGLLLFLLLRKLRLSPLVAGASSLLWLGLPVLSEPVAWISARAYLLSTGFMLLAALAALAFLQSQRSLQLALFFFFALCANFSHEQGVFLVAFLGIGYLFLREEKASRRWLMLAVAALLADGFYFAAKLIVGSHAGGGGSALWVAGREFWKYLGWIVLPVHMSVERSTDVPGNVAALSSFASLTFIVAWVALLSLIALVVLIHKYRPGLAASLSILLVGLLPYCGFVFIYQGMAERFTYLASIGFAVTLVLVVVSLRPFERKIAFGCIAAWIAWGGWRLMERVQDWQQPEALFRHSLEATPRSAFLLDNLGVVLRDGGDSDGALLAFQKAVQIKPDYARAISSIGEVYVTQGKLQPALAEYKRSLLLDPTDAKTILNYGAALQQVNRNAEAEQEYKRVVAMLPKDSAAYVDLESLYIAEGRQEEAIQMYKQAIAVNPNDPNAYFDLAIMFQSIGQNDDALVFYKKVLQLKPGDPQTLLNLSKLQAVTP